MDDAGAAAIEASKAVSHWHHEDSDEDKERLNSNDGVHNSVEVIDQSPFSSLVLGIVGELSETAKEFVNLFFNLVSSLLALILGLVGSGLLSLLLGLVFINGIFGLLSLFIDLFSELVSILSKQIEVGDILATVLPE